MTLSSAPRRQDCTLTILPLLAEAHNGSPIQRVIQEPAFSATDNEFCESLGFKTVDTPQAFEMIDSHTLVYGIHLYMPTWAEALSKQLPGCLVGTPFGVCETCVC